MNIEHCLYTFPTHSIRARNTWNFASVEHPGALILHFLHFLRLGSRLPALLGAILGLLQPLWCSRLWLARCQRPVGMVGWEGAGVQNGLVMWGMIWDLAIERPKMLSEPVKPGDFIIGLSFRFAAVDVFFWRESNNQPGDGLGQSRASFQSWSAGGQVFSHLDTSSRSNAFNYGRLVFLNVRDTT